MKNKTGRQQQLLQNIKIINEPKNDTDAVNKNYADRFIDQKELLEILNDNTILRNDDELDINNNNIINVNKIVINDNNGYNDNDVINKKYIDNLNLIKFIEANVDYIKVNVLNENYYLTRSKKQLLLSRTSYIYPNSGEDLLSDWTLDILDVNGVVNNHSFFKSSTLGTPSPGTGMAENTLPRLFIETSHPNHSNDNSTFCSMERRGLKNIRQILFTYGRHSRDYDQSGPKSMLRLDIDIINTDNSYTTIKSLLENTDYSDYRHGAGWKNMIISVTGGNIGVRFKFTHIKQANNDMDIQDILIYHEFS